MVGRNYAIRTISTKYERDRDWTEPNGSTTSLKISDSARLTTESPAIHSLSSGD